MSLGQKIIRGMGSSAASQIGTEVTRVAVMWWLMRQLGPEAFSAWALIFVVTNLAGMFVEFGFGTAIIQQKGAENDRDLVSSVYWIQTGIGLLFLVLLYIGAPSIAAFYHRPDLVPVYQICGINFVVAAQSSIPRALLQKALKFHNMAMVEVSAEIVASFAALVALPLGWLWPMVVWMLVRSLVKSALYWWFSGWVPIFSFSYSSVRPILSFCRNLIGAQIIDYGASNFDRVLLGKLELEGNLLGPYDRAASLTVMPARAIGRMVGRVMMPVVARFQSKKDHGLQLILFVLTCVNAVLVPYVALVMLRSDLIVKLVFGEQWVKMGPFMAVFSVSVFLAGFNAIAVSSLLAFGRADLNLRIGSFGRGVITLGWGLGALGGVFGMAIGRTLGAMVMTVALAWALATATDGTMGRVIWSFRWNVGAFVMTLGLGSVLPVGSSWGGLIGLGLFCGCVAWLISGVGILSELRKVRKILSSHDQEVQNGRA